MKISVIIAAYKGEKYITEQLQSIFLQTCQPDEILIGDDSQDNRMQYLIEKIAEDWHGRILYFHNKKQLGHINNFFNLMSKASGDLIFFSDQDDFWLPDKISKMKQLYLCNQADVLFCDSYVCDKDLEHDKTTLFHYKQNRGRIIRAINQAGGFKDIILSKIMLSGHNMLCSKSMVKVFEKRPIIFPHYDHWLAIVAAAAGKLYLNDMPLTLYRRHDDNVSTLCQTKERTLKQYFNSTTSNDIIDSFEKYAELRNALQQISVFYPIKEENLNLLDDVVSYFQNRLLFRSKTFLRKIFSLSFRFIKQHFLYASGIKSLVRDFIEIPCDQAEHDFIVKNKYFQR